METADLWIAAGIVFGLLILSAFFSGSETALTAASRPRMHELERQGVGAAGRVNRLRDNKERLIGAILLGNNLVNILASAFATSVLVGLFGDRGVAYATVGMTLLVLIFAEVLPKTYAINQPDRMALVVAPILRPIVFVFAPVTHAVEVVVRTTLRIMGAQVHDERGISTTEEELRGAIELHRAPDQEVHDERKMLRSILDLGDVEVGEIMTHRSSMVMIDAALPTGTIVEQVLDAPFTRIPLYRGEPDNIVGVVHAKALLRAIQGSGAPTDFDRIEIDRIAAPPWFIPEATTLLDQLQAFRERHEHFALVVDEYGSLMGLVTLEDILEEIVGEIADEHDVAVPGVHKQPDGSFVINGATTIRDLNREFEWSLPDEDASTIAGLVMYEARQIPEVGQSFAFHGFRFEILRRRKNRVTLIRVSPLENGEDAASA